MQRTQPEDRHSLRAPSGRAAAPIQGKRILYVDDEPLMRRCVERILRDAGATSLLAGTHDQAVKLAVSDPALALAIVDFHMPDGPVDTLLRRLRAANAALHVIGTSGEDRRRDFCKYGVTRFLPKPWQLDDLAQTAASILSANPRFPVALPLESRVDARPLAD